MTYRMLCNRLLQAGIENAEWDARLLAEHFCRVDSSLFLLDPDHEIECSDALLQAIELRASRYPLQYILGEWEFYRQTYEVSPDCLIPRSDTEILVEEAIKRLPPSSRFADLCTGSGCIAISVLAERPDTEAYAVEKYERTLALATRNAVKNAVRDRFSPICADVLCLDPASLGIDRLDAVLCNPPYIPTSVLKDLAPELDAEPRVALDGGEDGLIFYETLISRADLWLKPSGFFLFEIGYDQAESLRQIGIRYGFDGYQCIRDLGGNNRVIRLWRTHGIH